MRRLPPLHRWIGLFGLTAAVPAFAQTPQIEDVDSLAQMFGQGQIHGSLGALYYSTHNAYFSAGNHQDTAAYGGFANFTSARYHGFSFGIGALLQRGIDRGSPGHRVSELSTQQANLGEAYLKWQGKALTLTVGNQRLDIPFANSNDWRITPNLFQAADLHYGDADNFVELTRVFRYKPWGGGSFSKTTMYNRRWDTFSSVQAQTEGMWSLGGKLTRHRDALSWSVQGWHQHYLDYQRLSYIEGQLVADGARLKPLLGLQYLRAHDSGDALLGEVDGQVYGAQLGMSLGTFKVTLNYDHIPQRPRAYLNGVLPEPYFHNSSSGPIFAQPFFTSTQDLGSGNAYSLDMSGLAAERVVVGARYSFMDLRESAEVASRNQSEYMGFVVYNFAGALKGFSIADFLGVQRSPRDGLEFWQNRLELRYTF